MTDQCMVILDSGVCNKPSINAYRCKVEVDGKDEIHVIYVCEEHDAKFRKQLRRASKK